MDMVHKIYILLNLSYLASAFQSQHTLMHKIKDFNYIYKVFSTHNNKHNIVLIIVKAHC